MNEIITKTSLEALEAEANQAEQAFLKQPSEESFGRLATALVNLNWPPIYSKVTQHLDRIQRKMSRRKQS